MKNILLIVLMLPLASYAKSSSNTYQKYPHCRSQVIIDAIESKNKNLIDRAYFDMQRNDWWNSSTGCVKLLLNANVDFLKNSVEYTDVRGRPIFSNMFISISGSNNRDSEFTDVLKFMLNKRKAEILSKFDVNFQPRYQAPLNHAIELGDVALVKAYLDAGMDPHDALIYLAKPLRYLDFHKQAKIFELLKKNNVSCNLTDDSGHTALSRAFYSDDYYLAKELLNYKNCNLNKVEYRSDSSEKVNYETALTALIKSVQNAYSSTHSSGSSNPCDQVDADNSEVVSKFEELVRLAVKRDPKLLDRQPALVDPKSPLEIVSEDLDFYKSELKQLKNKCTGGNCACYELRSIKRYEGLISLKDRFVKAVSAIQGQGSAHKSTDQSGNTHEVK